MEYNITIDIAIVNIISLVTSSHGWLIGHEYRSLVTFVAPQWLAFQLLRPLEPGELVFLEPNAFADRLEGASNAKD